MRRKGDPTEEERLAAIDSAIEANAGYMGPTQHLPGSAGKIAVLAARAAELDRLAGHGVVATRQIRSLDDSHTVFDAEDAQYAVCAFTGKDGQIDPSA